MDFISECEFYNQLPLCDIEDNSHMFYDNHLNDINDYTIIPDNIPLHSNPVSINPKKRSIDEMNEITDKPKSNLKSNFKVKFDSIKTRHGTIEETRRYTRGFHHQCTACSDYIKLISLKDLKDRTVHTIIGLILIEYKHILHPFIIQYLERFNINIDQLCELIPFNWIEFIYSRCEEITVSNGIELCVANIVRIVCTIKFQNIKPQESNSMMYIFYSNIPYLTNFWHFNLFVAIDIQEEEKLSLLNKFNRCTISDLKLKQEKLEIEKFGAITKLMVNGSAICNREVEIGCIYYTMKCSERVYKPVELKNITTNLSTTIKNGIKPVIFTIDNNGVKSHVRYCLSFLSYRKNHLSAFATKNPKIYSIFNREYTSDLDLNKRNLLYGLYLLLNCSSSSNLFEPWEGKFVCNTPNEESLLIRFQKDLIKSCDGDVVKIMELQLSKWWNQHYSRNFDKKN